MKFVRTRRYLKDLKRLRTTEAEAAAIESAISKRPQAGDVIVGLGGARKLRFGLGGRGKSGGGRMVYVLMMSEEVAVLLTAYSKSEQSDLLPAARKEIRAIIEGMTDE